MKLEKRNVYIKEFWTMSYIDRLVYEFVNTVKSINKLELNPLKWNVIMVLKFSLGVVLFLMLLLMIPYAAHRLKFRKMPQSNDRFFRDRDDWYIENQWVVKKD